MNQNLYPISVKGLYGFINFSGEVVIQPKFEFAGTFCEGLAFAITTDYKSGFINESGEWAIEPKFEFPSARHTFFKFSEGWAPVLVGKRKYSYVNKNGATLDKTFDRAFPHSEGRALIVQDEKMGFLDLQGEMVIQPQYQIAYDWLPQASCFSEGWAVVRFNDQPRGMGFIDTSGETVIDPFFEEAYPFSEGLAQVRRSFNKGYWYLDKNAEYAIKPDFRIAGAGSFYEGLADAGTDETGLFGYINKKGEWAIEQKFQQTLRFSEGRAPVCMNGLWTFINSKGEFIEQPRFKSLSHFNRGLALVHEEGCYGYINLQGDYIWKSSIELLDEDDN